jgi:hypothetical protein
MSVITPEYPIVSDSTVSLEETPTIPSSHKHNRLARPVASDDDQSRDNELINYYFDSTWTTKDIADHFKLTVPQVAAWFQRSDIAALIDFVTAANERRARDIARANLPSTIDILHRISQVRTSDAAAREASCTLVRFARGPSLSKSASQRASKAKPTPGHDAGKQPHPDGPADRSSHTRARRAGDTPTCSLRDDRNTYTNQQPAFPLPCNIARATQHNDRDHDELHDIALAGPPQLISTYPSSPRTTADLISRAGTTCSPHHAPASQPVGLIRNSRG